ncbi:hypothetical protein NNJEOMEG_02072 [Fundidesulfovibrio magnetotacticus]|uniref:Polyhydroxyalkanoate synthesis regulator phasin n=1 Tax=Fundidesulfovibrio magnetotacticus TaxID=2730080 RepID=A0A6V8LTH0_9BACT|nr:hypothetical protein [Fundidesulfovibrio magnetotacticus]GFK94230.1 hypothetical protein NNJEOMEG_02072 [Fundidesulfovibrio magnetotacticus]
MKDLLKKGFYTGLGAGLLLKDEIMEALTPPVASDGLPLEELREHLRGVLTRVAQGAQAGAKEAADAGEAELDALLERLGLARVEDVETLQRRVADLEATLAAHKHGKPGKGK